MNQNRKTIGLKRTILLLISISFPILCFYFSCNREGKHSNRKKEVIPMELKGRITNLSGNAYSSSISLDNHDGRIPFNFGGLPISGSWEFPDAKYILVGDSIIKKSGSEEFTIKRGSNIAVFKLDCGD